LASCCCASLKVACMFADAVPASELPSAICLSAAALCCSRLSMPWADPPCCWCAIQQSKP
jgi:hypothetical protein